MDIIGNQEFSCSTENGVNDECFFYLHQTARFRHTVEQLPSNPYSQIRNIFIQGSKGTGKINFARMAWMKFKDPRRSFISIDSKNLTSEGDISRSLNRARKGDLYIKQAAGLSNEHLSFLLSKSELYRVRVIASDSQAQLSAFHKEHFQTLVQIPSLEEIRSEIVPIAKQILKGYANLNLTCEAEKVLRNHTWNQNVEELMYCIQRAHFMLEEKEVRYITGDLIKMVLQEKILHRRVFSIMSMLATTPMLEYVEEWGLKDFLGLLESGILSRAYIEHNENKTKSASQLRIPANTFDSKFKKKFNEINNFIYLNSL